MSNPIDEWECEYCGFVTTSESDYDDHTETHSEDN